LWSLLTTRQKQVLVALAKARKEDKIFSVNFLKKYHINSIGGMQRILKGLVEKNILDREESRYSLLDIFFKRWILKKN